MSRYEGNMRIDEVISGKEVDDIRGWRIIERFDTAGRCIERVREIEAKPSIIGEDIIEIGYVAEETRRYEYSDNGDLIGEIWINHFSPGANEIYYRYEYDAYHNIIAEYYKSTDTGEYVKSITYNYEYDNIGNWIEEQSYAVDGSRLHWAKRSITYKE